MKNVLVTGADGFIESHLTEMLVAQGCKVRALSQYNSFNNWGWLEQINCKNNIEKLSGDIRYFDCCKKRQFFFLLKCNGIFRKIMIYLIVYYLYMPIIFKFF